MKIKVYNQDKDVGSILWDLQRFGMTPRKLRNRLLRRIAPGRAKDDAKPLLLCSLPKAGTHLIETILCMHPHIHRPLVPTVEPRNIESFGGLRRLLSRARPGQLYVSHFPFSQDVLEAATETGTGIVYLKRDPRAVLASDIRYIDKRTDHYLHPYSAKLSSIHDKVRLQLDGVSRENVMPFADRLDAYRGWEEQPGVLSLRFEDIAPSGPGGTMNLDTLARLFAFAGASVTTAWLEALPARLPTRATPTFRSGTRQGWRSELPDDLIAEIQARLGPALARFGYD